MFFTAGYFVTPDHATPLSSAIASFLAEWRNSPCTLRSYRKEIERFLLWCELVRQGQPEELTHHDYRDYERFMQAPPEAWCGPKVPRFVDGARNPAWRPFERSLGVSSTRTAMRVINSLLSYLVETGALPANPLSLRRRRVRAEQVASAPMRYIEPAEQRIVWKSLHTGRHRTKRTKLIAERRRWVALLLYGTGLRISEATNAVMGDVACVEGRWRLVTIRKGRKQSWIPLSPEVMNAMKRYRLALGLSHFPSPGERTPLIAAINTMASISTRTGYDIVKRTVVRAAVRAEPRSRYHAARLRCASPHWFRHTMLTDLRRRGADLPALQRLADHSTPATTTRYLHVTEEPLYALVEKHKFHKGASPAALAA